MLTRSINKSCVTCRNPTCRVFRAFCAAWILKIFNKAEPGVKGDTVSGATKNAELETNVNIQVPLFINENELIKVDTRDMTYVGRAKS